MLSDSGLDVSCAAFHKWVCEEKQIIAWQDKLKEDRHNKLNMVLRQELIVAQQKKLKKIKSHGYPT